MLNQVILVGRVSHINKDEEEEKIISLRVEIERSHDPIIIDKPVVEIPEAMTDTISQYLKKGNMVGIKGRVECNSDEGSTIVAEKITFLSK